MKGLLLGLLVVLAAPSRAEPRLIVTPARLCELRQHQQDHEFRQLERALQTRGQRYLLEGFPSYRVEPPDSLLNQSRKALAHITTFALLHLLDGKPLWLSRAREEMLAVAAFPDWGPQHFLDTAEMTTAMAFGYDWLGDKLSPQDRVTIRQAIVEKGLQAGLRAYASQQWWSTSPFNWNLVCNGGMIIGALAVEKEEPVLASEVLARARDSIQAPLASFAPDGGWAEGPMYWAYATRYAVWTMAALHSAKGDDGGMSLTPGLEWTGLFALYCHGPCQENFNFADAESGLSVTPQLRWLARRFDLPVLNWEQEQRGSSATAFDIIWWHPGKSTPSQAQLPLDRLFQGVQVGFFRSRWEDPEALFVGFKGGDNQANHGHLDLGSFVLQARGQIWALDLGPDNYALPGYFDKAPTARYRYYRTSTRGHNTITFAGQNQLTKARASVTEFLSTVERACAQVDLSEAYGFPVKRRFELIQRRRLVITDEFHSPAAVEYVSGFHTRAHVSLNGPCATLKLGGESLGVRVTQPPLARLEVVSAGPEPPEDPNEGVKKLIVRLPASASATVVWEIGVPPGSGDP